MVDVIVGDPGGPQIKGLSDLQMVVAEINLGSVQHGSAENDDRFPFTDGFRRERPASVLTALSDVKLHDPGAVQPLLEYVRLETRHASLSIKPMERKTSASQLKTHGSFALAALVLWSGIAVAGPVRPPAADGARLYAHYCAACHGERGRGGIGLPLSLPSFLAGVDDSYLRQTIRLGRPGRIMPAFARLQGNQIDALVRYIRHWSGNRPVTLAAAGKPGNAVRGGMLFTAHCATCHGANGVGGEGTGVTLSRPRSQPIMAPALDNPGFLASASNRVIRTALVRGRAGTPMRSVLKQGLSERDIDDLVAYVRSFQDQPPPLAAPPRDEGPDIVGVSPDGVTATVARLKEAVEAANMRLIRVQYLDQGFVPAGTEDRNQVIVYSCDFGFLNTALQVDPRVGLFLPCRVTVLQHHGKVLVMSVNPKRLSTLFNDAALSRLCDQMYRKYRDVIEEATF